MESSNLFQSLKDEDITSEENYHKSVSESDDVKFEQQDGNEDGDGDDEGSSKGAKKKDKQNRKELEEEEREKML